MSFNTFLILIVAIFAMAFFGEHLARWLRRRPKADHPMAIPVIREGDITNLVVNPKYFEEPLRVPEL